MTILPLTGPDAGATPRPVHLHGPATAAYGGPAAGRALRMRPMSPSDARAAPPPDAMLPRWRSAPAVRRPRRRRTARAFLLAPMVPAALAALLMSAAGYQNASVFLLLFWFIPFCVVGHLSALFIGVPLYLSIPRDARDKAPAVMLLGGMVAALPWTVGGVLSGSIAVLVVATGVFGLGCIGGIAFALIR